MMTIGMDRYRTHLGSRINRPWWLDMVQGGRGLVTNNFRSESLDGLMLLLFIKIGSTGERIFLGEYQEFSFEHAYFDVLA